LGEGGAQSVYIPIPQQWDPLLSPVQSTKGYKIELTRDIPIHTIFGTTLKPDTVIPLRKDEENWVGYFLPYTQSIEDAVRNIDMGDIISIKSKYNSIWGTVPSNFLSGSTPNTISFGEMLVIVPEHNFLNFTWGQGQVREPTRKADTQFFEFEEKADYLPIFIEMDTDNPPAEIAAKVNGVVKGATVYEGEISEILTYLDEEDLNEEIEIVFGYHTRAPAQTITDFAVVNHRTQSLEYVPLIARAGVPYYHLKLNDKGNGTNELVAPFIQLQQNYPNPFNPDTKIDFYLSHEDNIRLLIYNIKGQKVKDLYVGNKPAGKHSLVWDGKDNNQKQVGSGIYFYKLMTRFGEVQRKMVLIK
jgi:hypothetical protein